MFSSYTNRPSLALSQQTHQRDSYPKAMSSPSSSSVPTYSDLSMHHAVSFSTALPTAPTEIPRGGGGFFHGNGGLFSLPNVVASAPPPYPSSLPSYYIHRSTSTHSFPLHLQFPDPLSSNATTFSCPSPSAYQFPLPPVSSPPSSSSGDFLEFSSANMRRVFSTGDLQGMNVSPPPQAALPPLRFSGDSCSQEAGEPFSEKVGRYSAEERKERIERYRIKRHQRNFHKKITYACRKTLADSRPRVQGRFARNAEMEVAELEREASDNRYEYCPYNDIASTTTNRRSSCYGDSQSRYSEIGNSTILDDTKWWWGTPVSANVQQQKLGFDVDVDLDDEDQLWASLADMCSGPELS